MIKYSKGQILRQRILDSNCFNRILLLKDCTEDDSYIYGLEISTIGGKDKIRKDRVLKLDNDGSYMLDNKMMISESVCNLYIQNIKDRTKDPIVHELEENKIYKYHN